MTDYDIDGEPHPLPSPAPGAPVARCCNRLVWNCRCMRECEECGWWLEGWLSCGDCHDGGRL